MNAARRRSPGSTIPTDPPCTRLSEAAWPAWPGRGPTWTASALPCPPEEVSTGHTQLLSGQTIHHPWGDQPGFKGHRSDRGHGLGHGGIAQQPPILPQVSRGLPTCPALFLGTGTNFSGKRGVPEKSRPVPSVKVPLCWAMATSSIALVKSLTRWASLSCAGHWACGCGDSQAWGGEGRARFRAQLAVARAGLH